MSKAPFSKQTVKLLRHISTWCDPGVHDEDLVKTLKEKLGSAEVKDTTSANLERSATGRACPG